MNGDTKKLVNKEAMVRVSKKDRRNLKGSTNWAALVAEEKKENQKK